MPANETAARRIKRGSGAAAHIVNLEVLVKDADAAQNAFAFAEACGVEERVLRSMREAAAASVAIAEQAESRILRAGEARETIAVRIDQMQSYRKSTRSA